MSYKFFTIYVVHSFTTTLVNETRINRIEWNEHFIPLELVKQTQLNVVEECETFGNTSYWSRSLIHTKHMTVKLMSVESGWLPPCARGAARWVYCQSALNADTVTFFPRHPSIRDNSANVSQPYTPKCHSWLRRSPLLITFLQKYRPAGILQLATCW